MLIKLFIKNIDRLYSFFYAFFGGDKWRNIIFIPPQLTSIHFNTLKPTVIRKFYSLPTSTIISTKNIFKKIFSQIFFNAIKNILFSSNFNHLWRAKKSSNACFLTQLKACNVYHQIQLMLCLKGAKERPQKITHNPSHNQPTQYAHCAGWSWERF